MLLLGLLKVVGRLRLDRALMVDGVHGRHRFYRVLGREEHLRVLMLLKLS